MENLVQQRQSIEADTKMSSEEQREKVEALQLDGASVDSLCLDFTYPGLPGV